MSSTSSAASATARCGWPHDAGQARLHELRDGRHVRGAHAAPRLHGAVTADARRRRHSPRFSRLRRRLSGSGMPVAPPTVEEGFMAPVNTDALVDKLCERLAAETGGV